MSTDRPANLAEAVAAHQAENAPPGTVLPEYPAWALQDGYDPSTDLTVHPSRIAARRATIAQARLARGLAAHRKDQP